MSARRLVGIDSARYPEIARNVHEIERQVESNNENWRTRIQMEWLRNRRAFLRLGKPVHTVRGAPLRASDPTRRRLPTYSVPPTCAARKGCEDRSDQEER